MERRLRQAHREGLIYSDYLGEQIGEAEKAGVINKKEAAQLHDYHEKVRAMLAVDDFASEELRRTSAAPAPAPARAASDMTGKATKKKVAPRKKASRKKAAKKTAKKAAKKAS